MLERLRDTRSPSGHPLTSPGGAIAANGSIDSQEAQSWSQCRESWRPSSALDS